MTNREIKQEARRCLDRNTHFFVGIALLLRMLTTLLILLIMLQLSSWGGENSGGETIILSGVKLVCDPAVIAAGVGIALTAAAGTAVDGVLSLGIHRVLLERARGQEKHFRDLFRGIRRKAWTGHHIGMLVILWLIRLFIMLPENLILMTQGNGEDYRITVFLSSFVLLAVGLFTVLAPFVSADHGEMKGFQTVKRSWMLMQNRKWRLCSLLLSLSGWYLLIVATLGAAWIFVEPYIMEVLAVFYLEVSRGEI